MNCNETCGLTTEWVDIAKEWDVRCLLLFLKKGGCVTSSTQQMFLNLLNW